MRSIPRGDDEVGEREDMGTKHSKGLKEYRCCLLLNGKSISFKLLYVFIMIFMGRIALPYMYRCVELSNLENFFLSCEHGGSTQKPSI